MPVVTRDATSGNWLPQSTAEATSLYAGSTVAIPTLTALFLCQEVSGSLADSTGNGHTLTNNASGTATYAGVVSGWSTKAVTPGAGTTRMFQDGTWADASSTVFAVLNFPASQAAQGNAITFGGTFSAQVGLDLHASTSPTKIDVVTTSDTQTTGTNNTTAVHPVIVTANKTAASGTVQTDLETLTHATTAGNSWGALSFGGDFTQFWNASGVGYMHAMAWSGTTSAEFTATQRSTLLDRFANGPAISSISVSPSTATIVTLGSTQALTATSTRVDTSTIVNTAAVTWLSSNPSVATVNAAGVVTAIANGTANITCTFTSFNALTATSNTSIINVSAGAAATVPLPVVGVDIPDHVAAATARLLEQDKAKTNVIALVSCLVTPMQAVESALWQLLTQRRATTAIGSNLDALGKIVGQPRNGLSDADYQTYISARISANRSSGLVEDLLRVAKTLINNTAALITVSYGGAGTVTIRVTGITRTDAQGQALASFMQQAIAAGIRVLVIYSNVVVASTFCYDTGPGYDVGRYATAIG